MEAQFEWQASSPESQEMDSGKLNGLWENLQYQGTKAFLVARNDSIIFEQYSDGWDQTKAHYTASMAKAIVGGVSLGLAMDDGLIGPDDFACKFVPQWKDDPKKSKIQIKHLASHTSGLDMARPKDQGGWQQLFWERKDVPDDPFTVARDHVPVVYETGSKNLYSNPGMAMLSYCVTAAIQNGPHKDVRTLLRERVMNRIGVKDDEWHIGYGQTFEMDGMPMVANWGGGNYTARAVARVGRLMMRNGDWDGERIISSQVVDQLLAHCGTPNHSGLAWWINRDQDGNKTWASFPDDAFIGLGSEHQVLAVVPSLNMVVVRNGKALTPKAGKALYENVCEDAIFEPLMEAAKTAVAGRT